MSLRDAQAAVHRFMVKAGQETPERPCIPSLEVRDLRITLHDEEAVKELTEAFCTDDKAKVADSIADSLVVILGTAVACGIDIEPIFQEVMRSNMSKFIDGHRREDGKWMKGPSYSPANIAPLIEGQLKGNREPDFWAIPTHPIVEVMSQSEHCSKHFTKGEKWAFSADKCANCGTTERPHEGRGLCGRCYARTSIRAKHPRTKGVQICAAM